MTLQFIYCERCDKKWLVGIDGKKVSHSNVKGGILMGKHFMEGVLDVSEQVKSMICGKPCRVKDIGTVE